MFASKAARSILTLAFVAVAVFAAHTSQVSGAAMSGGIIPSVGKPSTGHLYVADLYYGTVVRYPMSAQGLAQTTPDGAITGLDFPTRLAIDKNGFIYVVTGSSSTTVDVFAPGANGGVPPVRTIEMPPQYANLYDIAVDAQGYVYVSAGSSGDQILVLAPGAKGNAVPVNVLSGNLSSYWGIAVSGGAPLYGLTELGILVFDHPRREATYDSVILPSTYEHLYYNTMAISISGDRLWVHYEPQYVHSRWQLTDYVALSLPQLKHFSHIDAGDCRRGFTPGFQGGSAANDRYLYVSCNDKASAVFVYAADKNGRQWPVEVLTQGLFDPLEVAIGP